ncbi:DNA repair protein xrcc2 [Coemansia guatemalensis]|uniref:DNA repair protein xrcc2 n=1 Tax=Coemansia guatemalensis TaxID=2761395 RepID=A0A9W8HXB4_9FUNG|nr:DNA repair protein xrcc2 [Coemansia guatemalensis]
MSAELWRLLKQVRTESGREAVAAATGQGTPAVAGRIRMWTGVEAIDTALRQTDGAQTVVELAGAAGSGKTQTLYRICAAHALAETDGEYGHVLFIDVDGRMDVRQLAQTMRATAGDDAAATEALRRVHVFAPATTSALIATLATLGAYVGARRVRATAVVVDGLGCNHWIDQREAAHVRLRIRRATAWFRQQQQLVDTLVAAGQALQCVVVAANTLLLAPSHSADRPVRLFTVAGREYRDHMIPRWRDAVLCSLTLESEPCHVHGQQLTRICFRPSGAPRDQQHGVAFIGRQGLQDTAG